MPRASRFPIVVASLSLFLAGCDDNIINAPSNPPAPTIALFTAVPGAIQVGDSTELTWRVDGPLTSLMLDDGGGDVINVLQETKVVAFPTANASFTLTARNNYGSATATATVAVTSAGGDPGSPPAPRSLTASDLGYGFPLHSVELRWQGSPLAASYLIERRAPGTSFHQVLVSSPYYYTYASDGSLTTASTFYYRVRAVSATGAKSTFSNEAAVTTGGTPLTISSIQVSPATVPDLGPGATFFLMLSTDVPGYGSLSINPTLFTWTSTNPAVATVDAFGLVIAGAAGSTQITASLSGVTSNAVTVNVAAPGAGGPLSGTWRQSVYEYWRNPLIRRN